MAGQVGERSALVIAVGLQGLIHLPGHGDADALGFAGVDRVVHRLGAWLVGLRCNVSDCRCLLVGI